MTSGGLPKYEKYRPARLSWLGEIPAHWEEKRAKFFFREVDERSASGEEELLSVSHVTGVTPRSQKNVTMFKAESYAGHKMCQPGDLVINTMWAWMAALGVARQTGIVSSSYGVYRPIKTETFVPEYVDGLLRTKPYATEYFCRSKGIRPSRLRLYPEKFLDIPVTCPPRDEQERMVYYMREKDRQIHRFIRNKRQRIELLNEQKLNIIKGAVTRGINPDVRLNPSGINWLGEVPEHWALKEIKYEFRCLNEKRIPLSAVEREQMKQREYDYYGASGVIDKVDEYLFDDDLILIAEDGANLVLRNLPLSIIARGKFWVNNHAHILKPKKGNLEYFANLLEVIDYRQWITGAAQPKLTQDRLMAIKVPVPQVEEQIKIVDFIAAETSTLIDVIKRTKREVELIREYRKRIIADVVTGKVDVRHLAAETGELTLDDAEVLVNATDLLMDEEAEDLEASEEELTLADD